MIKRKQYKELYSSLYWNLNAQLTDQMDGVTSRHLDDLFKGRMDRRLLKFKLFQ